MCVKITTWKVVCVLLEKCMQQGGSKIRIAINSHRLLPTQPPNQPTPYQPSWILPKAYPNRKLILQKPLTRNELCPTKLFTLNKNDHWMGFPTLKMIIHHVFFFPLKIDGFPTLDSGLWLPYVSSPRSANLLCRRCCWPARAVGAEWHPIRAS